MSSANENQDQSAPAKKPLKPKKGSKAALSEVRHFRLSPQAAAGWDAKVASSGMTASEFFRKAVINNETKVTRKKEGPSPDYRRLLFYVAQIGNNINQLARRANEDYRSGVISQTTYRLLLEELSAISMMIKGVL